jgi:hypothetical protein
MENLHLIKVKYIGPTDFNGAKIKLFSQRFNHSITLLFDYKFNNSIDIAIDYLVNNNYNIIGVADYKKSYFIVTNTFKPLK